MLETNNGREKNQDRQFSVEEIAFKGRTITIVAVEHEHTFLADGTTPPDWLERITPIIKDCSVVFLEYFPPELERNVYNKAFLGKIAKNYAETSNIDTFFNAVAEVAADFDRPVAVADIANKPLYLVYEYLHAFPSLIPGVGLFVLPYTLMVTFQELFRQGHKHPRETKFEKVFPMATDARRLISALALMQEAMERDENSTIVYVGPPAHADRMSNYIKNGLSLADHLRTLPYKGMIGLDRSRRMYKRLKSGAWIEISNIPVKH